MLIKAGVQILGLQICAAILQLTGIRLTTSALTPEEFGRFSLGLGYAMLAANICTAPSLQCLLRYYPEYRATNGIQLLQDAVYSTITAQLKFVSPILLLIGLYGLYAEYIDVGTLAALPILVIAEAIKSCKNANLNAEEQHKKLGLIIVNESWLRPAAIWATALLVAPTSAVALLAASFATFAALAIGGGWTKTKTAATEYSCSDIQCKTLQSDLRKTIRIYIRPLVPLGLLGWLSSMSDRYIIGYSLSMSEAGYYAAIFSIASRPILMVGASLESLFRQKIQSAMSTDDKKLLHELIYKWTVTTLAFSIPAIAAAQFLHPLIGTYLLAAKFSAATSYIPLIVASHCLLILSHIPNRISYASDKTRTVFITELLSAITVCTLLAIMCPRYGVVGACWAMIVSMMVRLFISIILAKR